MLRTAARLYAAQVVDRRASIAVVVALFLIVGFLARSYNGQSPGVAAITAMSTLLVVMIGFNRFSGRGPR
jgi:hypothetical protein